MYLVEITGCLSHTLIVVVQWPKFGHSTTLNNKGYKAHKEMGHNIIGYNGLLGIQYINSEEESKMQCL